MEYKQFDNKYYVRLDPDDEVIASLRIVCEKENIRLGQVQGIGGCREATVGVFDQEKKAYQEKTVISLLEMLSLDGNITEADDKPFLHLHAAFAYREGDVIKTLAGHLLKATVGLTGEIVITPADGHIRRKFIDELGIRVWEFA